MSQIAIKPFVLKDCLLTITTRDAVPVSGDYEGHVSKVQFTPSATTKTWSGLTPASQHTATATATWTAELDLAQDWETPASLSRFLHENEGKTVDAIFEPKAGGAAVTAALVITPGLIGGAGNDFATSSVKLGVSGKPDVAAAA